MTAAARFAAALDGAWRRAEPLRLGAFVGAAAACDRYCLLTLPGGERLRADLYRSGDEACAFEEARFWGRFAAIGWGHAVYLVELATQRVVRHELGAYFAHLYADAAYLLASSAAALHRFDADGGLLWTSAAVGLDGVVVEAVAGDAVSGRGEWDPPGGWRPFRLSLRTGRPV